MFDLDQQSESMDRKRYKNLSQSHVHVQACSALLYDIMLSCRENRPVGVLSTAVDSKKFVIMSRDLQEIPHDDITWLRGHNLAQSAQDVLYKFWRNLTNEADKLQGQAGEAFSAPLLADRVFACL